LTGNPYQPPSADSAESPDPPNTTLATWAIWLALILGATPIGADLLDAASLAQTPFYHIVLPVLFIAAMVTPVALLFLKSRFGGFAAAPIRITISCLIIVLYVYAYGTVLIRRF